MLATDKRCFEAVHAAPTATSEQPATAPAITAKRVPCACVWVLAMFSWPSVELDFFCDVFEAHTSQPSQAVKEEHLTLQACELVAHHDSQEPELEGEEDVGESVGDEDVGESVGDKEVGAEGVGLVPAAGSFIVKNGDLR